MMKATAKKTRRRRVTVSRRSGPKALTGSREAKRQAAAILEVLSGVRGPQEGSQALGVSLTRYYLLETRGLQGLIQALEPRPKGRQKGPEDELAALKHDNTRLQREVVRQQALVRAAQRSLGLPPSASPVSAGKLRDKRKKTGKTRRRRRTTVRARKVIAQLRSVAAPASSSPSTGKEVAACPPDAAPKV